MQVKLGKFLQEESGATSIEYALISTFIALAIIVSATAVGGGVSNAFNNVQNSL